MIEINLNEEATILHGTITRIASAMIVLGEVWANDVNLMRKLALQVDWAASPSGDFGPFDDPGDKPDLPRLFADAFSRASERLLDLADDQPQPGETQYTHPDRELSWFNTGERLRKVRLKYYGAKNWSIDSTWESVAAEIRRFRSDNPSARDEKIVVGVYNQPIGA